MKPFLILVLCYLLLAGCASRRQTTATTDTRNVITSDTMAIVIKDSINLHHTVADIFTLDSLTLTIAADSIITTTAGSTIHAPVLTICAHRNRIKKNTADILQRHTSTTIAATHKQRNAQASYTTDTKTSAAISPWLRIAGLVVAALALTVLILRLIAPAWLRRLGLIP